MYQHSDRVQTIRTLAEIFHGTIPESSIQHVVCTVSSFVNGSIEADTAIQEIHFILGDSELARHFEGHLASARVSVPKTDPIVPYTPVQSEDTSRSSTPTFIAPRAGTNASSWTPEEDKRLIEAVQRHKGRNWKAIAKEVNPDKNPDQCSQHWFRVLNPDIRKGKWSEEEDAMLLDIITRIGTGSWKDIAARMKGRTDIQVRYRYARLRKQFSEKGKRHSGMAK